MTKNTVIGVLAVALLAAGAYFTFSAPAQVPTPTNTPIGAMPGAELPGPDFTVGGLQELNYSGSFNKASTTLFAFKTPNATTSILVMSMQNTVGTGTAATWVIASSTSAYSTTTASNIMGAQTVAANATEGFVWTSVGGAVRDNILPPNTWVLGKTEGVGLSGYTYTGTYKVKLLKL